MEIIYKENMKEYVKLSGKYREIRGNYEEICGLGEDQHLPRSSIDSRT